MKYGVWMVCSLVLLTGGGAAFGQSVLLDDTFTTGAARLDPASQPTSIPWLAQTSSQLAISSNTLKQTGSGIVLGYVTPQTLNTGDSLTLSFSFTATGIANQLQGFRLGLFSSGGAAVSDNFASTAGTTFNGYQGYGVYDDLGTTGSSTEAQLFRRIPATAGTTGTQNNIMGGGYPSPIGPTAAGANLTSGTLYTGTLTITNNGANDTISYSLGGTTLTFTDSTHYTSFDTIAIQLNNQATSVAFSEIKLTYNAVPEASASALLGMAGGLVLVGGRLLSRRQAA